MATVKQLRNLAKDKNMKGYGEMRKADSLRVLNIERATNQDPNNERFKENCKKIL